jgi:hypothetical protein
MYDYCLMPHEQALEIGNSKTSVLKYLFICWYILMGEKEKKICHEMHIIITLLFNEIQTNVIQILFIPQIVLYIYWLICV